LATLSCLKNPQEARFEDKETIGTISYQGVDIRVKYSTLKEEKGILRIRAQTPNLTINIASRNPQAVTLSFLLKNMRRNTVPNISAGSIATTASASQYSFNYTVNPLEVTSITIESYANQGDYKIGIVGDIQNNIEIGHKIAADTATRALDFFIVVGDFVQQSEEEQFRWALELSDTFAMPVYVAFGNHEDFNGGYERFKNHFGRTNYDFIHKGDLYLILDSASQSISQDIFNYTRDVLSAHSGNKFVFLHVPPFDQYGMRNNSFTSRYQAARFVNMLLDQNTNIVFSGHIHSYQDYYIESLHQITVGTGGGIAEKLDGVGYGYVILERSGENVNTYRVEQGGD